MTDDLAFARPRARASTSTSPASRSRSSSASSGSPARSRSPRTRTRSGRRRGRSRRCRRRCRSCTCTPMPAGSRCGARSPAQLGVAIERARARQRLERPAVPARARDLRADRRGAVASRTRSCSYRLPRRSRAATFVAAPVTRGARVRCRRADRGDHAAHEARRARHAEQPDRLGRDARATPSACSRALPARALLVIDEAYAEYAAEWPEVDHVDGLALRAQRSRASIVLRTFSKIYGLAGLRVGYAVADRAVIEMLGRVGRTFHVVEPRARRRDRGARRSRSRRDRARATRARRSSGCAPRSTGRACACYPSLANFVLIECGRPSAPIYDQLLRLRRDRAADGGVGPADVHPRVGRVATHDMPRVIGALNDVLA